MASKYWDGPAEEQTETEPMPDAQYWHDCCEALHREYARRLHVLALASLATVAVVALAMWGTARMSAKPWTITDGDGNLRALVINGVPIFDDHCCCGSPSPSPSPSASASASASGSASASASASPFPGSGWYCILYWGTDVGDMDCGNLVCQGPAGDPCVEITDQAGWDAYNLGECTVDEGGGYGVVMYTLSGVYHDIQESCEGAGCECP